MFTGWNPLSGPIVEQPNLQVMSPEEARGLRRTVDQVAVTPDTGPTSSAQGFTSNDPNHPSLPTSEPSRERSTSRDSKAKRRTGWNREDGSAVGPGLDLGSSAGPQGFGLSFAQENFENGLGFVESEGEPTRNEQQRGVTFDLGEDDSTRMQGEDLFGNLRGNGEIKLPTNAAGTCPIGNTSGHSYGYGLEEPSQAGGFGAMQASAGL